MENAIRRPSKNRRNALFADHDEGGRNWARFASLIGTCKINGVELYANLFDLFTHLANGDHASDIGDLVARHIPRASRPHNELVRYYPVSELPPISTGQSA